MAERERQSPLPADGYLVGVVGGPGNGKTTLCARLLLREILGNYRITVIFDPTRDVLERLGGNTAAAGGEKVPPSWVKIVGTAAQARDALYGTGTWWSPKARSRVVVFQPKGKANLDELAKEWLDVVDDDKSRGICWMADEAQLVFRNAALKGSPLNVCTLTRNRQQIGLWTTQRPQNISTTLRMNSQHACVFGGESMRYLDPGCAEFGEVTAFEPALSLPRFHYLYRPPRREDPFAPLDELDARTDEIPWE